MQPIPLPLGPIPLWKLAYIQNVERTALWEALGPPHYTETDDLRTFGGEEDYWAFEISPNVLLGIILMVNYHGMEIISNQRVLTPELRDACAVLPGELQEYPEAYFMKGR